jgi:rRNA maturation endonuclease Nob1
MGFMRKALFLGTGGLSGAAGIKANSKKERTAKALEKQVRLQKQMLKAQQAGPIAQQATVTPQLYWMNCPNCRKALRAPVSENLQCPRCGSPVSMQPPANIAKQAPAKSPVQLTAHGGNEPRTTCPDCGHTNMGRPRRCTKCGTDLCI